MIPEIKNVLATALIEAGVAPARIARSEAETLPLKTGGNKELYASLITEVGRYALPDRPNQFAVVLENGNKKWIKARIRRRLPLLVQITGESEDVVDEVFSRFIALLPRTFALGDMDGLIEPEKEEHSDFDSRLRGRYRSAVLIMCSVDVAPAGMDSQKLNIGKMEGGISNG